MARPAMKWYGSLLIGVFVAAMGLLLWQLPAYAPEGATYGSFFPITGIASLAVGLLLAGRGIVQAAR